MVILIPKSVRFNWFTSLVEDDISRRSAYLAYVALNETETVITDTKTGHHLVIGRPEVFIIKYGDPSYEAVIKYVINNTGCRRVSQHLRKHDDAVEFEFRYDPDTLGMYLSEDLKYMGCTLERGIYIVVPNITRYLEILKRYGLYVDPNTVIGVVFYHEYMHLILDALGLNDIKKCVNRLCMHDILEVACEGLGAVTTPWELSKMCTNVPFLGDFYLGSIKGEAIIKILNYEINVKYAYQLMDRKTFLSLPRTYPYRLVRNFFNDNEKIGWLLIEEFLSVMTKETGLKDATAELQPKVFIVIKDSSQREYSVDLGHKYKWRPGLIY